MHVRPLNDRVLVKRLEEETKTPGGIIIPDNNKEKPVRGEVVSVGPGHRKETGGYQPLEIKEGDNVLYGKYAGTEVKVDGKEFLIMREDDILAVMSK